METVIKEEIVSLRSDSNSLFIFFMAVLTGSTAVLFKVLTNEITAGFAIVSAVGLAVAFFVLLLILKTRREIDGMINKLKELAKEKECQ